MNNNYRLSTEQFNIIQNQIQPKIEDGLIQSVDARRLHQWLGIGKDFSTWIKDQIERAGLVEHEDYEILLPRNGEQDWGGSNRKDYALTPDAAKEIAMMSSSDKGKLIRNYFIDCEKRLKEPEITINSPRAQLFLELARQAQEIEEAQKVIEYKNVVIEQKEEEIEELNSLLIRQYGRELSATDVAKLLCEKFQVIEGDQVFIFNPSSHDISEYWREQKITYKNGKHIMQNWINDCPGLFVISGRFDTLRLRLDNQFANEYLIKLKAEMIKKGIGKKKLQAPVIRRKHIESSFKF